jgi:hypothetical protein
MFLGPYSKFVMCVVTSNNARFVGNMADLPERSTWRDRAVYDESSLKRWSSLSATVRCHVQTWRLVSGYRLRDQSTPGFFLQSKY